MRKRARIILRTLLCLALTGLAACQTEDPRIAEAEAVAAATCACVDQACAQAAAAPLQEIRGLEQEDYANLPADQIARYETALARMDACVQAFNLE